jgi:hypothetical protein
MGKVSKSHNAMAGEVVVVEIEIRQTPKRPGAAQQGGACAVSNLTVAIAADSSHVL